MRHLAIAVAAALLVAPTAEAACGTATAARVMHCLVNEVRERHGLPGVSPDARLEQAAELYAADMVGRGYFSHRSPEGKSVADRAERYIARAWEWMLGENLAWGLLESAAPQSVLDAFMASPAHRRVLLDRRFRELGVGVAAGTPRDAYAEGATYALFLGRTWRRPPRQTEPS